MPRIDVATLDKCPHCGNDDQFYVQVIIKGRAQYNYRFDGDKDKQDNMHLHDYLDYKHLKTAYCEVYNHPLGTFEG